MKTYRLLLGLASFFSVMVFATQGHAQTQQPVASQTMSNQLNKEQIKRLDLDAKELKDLNQINRAYNREMKKLNRKSSVNREKDVEALKRSHSLKIKSLLSSEKYRNYLEMKKEEEESDAN